MPATPYYCGGARELDDFIVRMEQILEGWSSKYPNSKIKIATATAYFSTWSKHADAAYKDRSSIQVDPTDWAQSILRLPSSDKETNT